MTQCEWIGVNHVGSVQPDSYRTHHQLDTGWPALTWLQAQPFQNRITFRNTGWVWLYVIMKLLASLTPESTENTENIHRPLTFFTFTIFVGFCIRTARIIFHSCKLSPWTWGDYSHQIYWSLVFKLVDIFPRMRVSSDFLECHGPLSCQLVHKWGSL